MEIKAYIPYMNGYPNFNEEGWQIINENGIGFAAIGDIPHNPEDGRILAYVTVPAEIVERIKAGEWADFGVEWVENVEELQEGWFDEIKELP